MIALLSAASWGRHRGGGAERFTLGSGDRIYETGFKAATGTLASVSLLRVWSNTGTRVLERWSMPQA